MQNRSIVASLMLAVCVLFVATPQATSQEQKEEVRYRCVEWKTKHIHDEAQAKSISKTLTDLKCEVQQSSHNGHVDLKYRCPAWRKMSLKTHADAHKWEKWLKEYGFETEHHH